MEVGWPFTETAAQGGRAIQPAEIKAAVWHSIIAGARGIIYFNHSFGGPNQSSHCLRDPEPLPAYAAHRAAVTKPMRSSRNLRQCSMHHSRTASSAPVHPSGRWRSSMTTSTTCLPAAKRIEPAHQRSRCRVSIAARPRSLARIGRFPSQMVGSRTALQMAMRSIFTGLIISELSYGAAAMLMFSERCCASSTTWSSRSSAASPQGAIIRQEENRDANVRDHAQLRSRTSSCARTCTGRCSSTRPIRSITTSSCLGRTSSCSRQLAGPRTHIRCEADFLPARSFPYRSASCTVNLGRPFPPVRGWILQQVRQAGRGRRIRG